MVTKDYYQTYSDLNFSVRENTKPMVNKVFLLKEWSQHSNGNKYYSLFDSQDNWYGYVNADAVVKSENQAGIWHQTNEYVTGTKHYYSTYSDFNFKLLGSTKNMLYKTYIYKADNIILMAIGIIVV